MSGLMQWHCVPSWNSADTFKLMHEQKKPNNLSSFFYCVLCRWGGDNPEFIWMTRNFWGDLSFCCVAYHWENLKLSGLWVLSCRCFVRASQQTPSAAAYLWIRLLFALWNVAVEVEIRWPTDWSSNRFISLSIHSVCWVVFVSMWAAVPLEDLQLESEVLTIFPHHWWGSLVWINVNGKNNNPYVRGVRLTC